MKPITDLPIFVIGLLALTVAVWKAMAFLSARDPHSGVPDLMVGVNNLWWAVGAAVIMVVCVVAYFVHHPRVEEEIHISR